MLLVRGCPPTGRKRVRKPASWPRKATKNGSLKKSYLLGGALLHDPVMLVLLFGCFANRIRLIRVRHDDDGAALATGKEAHARRPTVGRIIGDWANAKGNHGTEQSHTYGGITRIKLTVEVVASSQPLRAPVRL